MSDRISARCPGCSATLGLPLYTAGKRIRCPKCQAVVDVPLDAELLDPGPHAKKKRSPESPAAKTPPRPERPPQHERPPQREQSPYRDQSQRFNESRKGSSASRAEPTVGRKSPASPDDNSREARKQRTSGSSVEGRTDARGAQPSRTGGRQSPERSESSGKRPKADHTEDTYGNELDFIADYGHSSDYETSYEAPTLPPRQKAASKRSRSTESSGSYGATVDEGVSGQVLIGIAMMVGAVAWFVGGLMMLDRIFIYPPVMFVLGAISSGKGMLQFFTRGSAESNTLPLTTGERVVRLAVFLSTFLIVKLFVVALMIHLRRGPVGLLEVAIAGAVAGVTAVLLAKGALVIFRMITKRGAS
jgi:hypothetical protein